MKYAITSKTKLQGHRLTMSAPTGSSGTKDQPQTLQPFGPPVRTELSSGTGKLISGRKGKAEMRGRE